MKYSRDFKLCYCHKAWIDKFTPGHYYAFKNSYYYDNIEIYYVTKKGNLCVYRIERNHFENFFNDCSERLSGELMNRLSFIEHTFRIAIYHELFIDDDLHYFHYCYRLRLYDNYGMGITVESDDNLTNFDSQEKALKYGIKMAKKAVNYIFLNKKPIKDIIYAHFRGEISQARAVNTKYKRLKKYDV